MIFKIIISLLVKSLYIYIKDIIAVTDIQQKILLSEFFSERLPFFGLLVNFN